MQVSCSVLDNCKDSFVSVDEKCQKASIQLFVVTTLMALLCHHDRVLWLVNMTSAGEKQYYVLALIQCLLNHLSNDVSLSILYDIGCQLPCVTFAISVFHTFGHQWPCQIVYHPCKREGFGLMDGEGCKRFWRSLKVLVPGLCVSGVCIFSSFSTPDSSINHSIISKFLLWMHRLHIWMTNCKSSSAIGCITAGSIVRLRSMPCSTSLMSVMYLKQSFTKNGPTNYTNRHGPHTVSHFEIHLFDCDSMFLGQAWNKGHQMVEVVLALKKSLLNYNGRVDEPPHQIPSYTLLFSLFLHFPYIADPPLCTSAPTRLHAITLALARQSHSLYWTDLAYLMDI